MILIQMIVLLGYVIPESLIIRLVCLVEIKILSSSNELERNLFRLVEAIYYMFSM